MPDRDDLGGAWRVPPSRYLASRPAEFAVGAPTSVYVTMPDGCRLAVDVMLPNGNAGKRWPTMLILTPYIRRFELKPGAMGVEPSPNSYRYRDMFVPRGYAVVVVDARGTGASFGTRDSFRSPRERLAVKEHLANFRMPDFMSEFKCRDDALPYDPSFTSASFSPYNYLDDIPRDVAVYAVSGWMDGAGYANGALSRFLTLPNPER